jgi:hypothetical protein
MLRLMTTVVTTPTDRPVFVAADGRRARRLRYAAVVAVVVAFAWVTALAIGMLGFDGLPSVSLPLVARGADGVPSQGAEQAGVPPTAVSKAESIARARATVGQAGAAPMRSSNVVGRTSYRPAAATPATAGRKASRRRTTRPSAPAVQPLAPAAPTITPARQGWARRGVTAPPGQARRTAPETVPVKNHQSTAVPPGQTRRLGGNEATTAPATPVTTPEPPGQQKKADETEQTA